jgi:hypothetical protein
MRTLGLVMAHLALRPFHPGLQSLHHKCKELSGLHCSIAIKAAREAHLCINLVDLGGLGSFLLRRKQDFDGPVG